MDEFKMDAKSWLSDRVGDLKGFLLSSIVTKVISELAELIPDILSALADGSISPEEAAHLEARMIEQVSEIFGKEISHEQADKIIAGITEIAKLAMK